MRLELLVPSLGFLVAEHHSWFHFYNALFLVKSCDSRITMARAISLTFVLLLNFACLLAMVCSLLLHTTNLSKSARAVLQTEQLAFLYCSFQMVGIPSKKA
jgi:hypothetical protein